MDGFSNFDWFANSRMFIGGKSPGFRNFSALALHRDGWGKNNWWKLVNLHLQPVALLLKSVGVHPNVFLFFRKL